MSAASVNTQNPFPYVLRTKGCSRRSASISSACDRTGPVVASLKSRTG